MPPRANKLVNQMNSALNDIQHDPSVETPADAGARIDAVIAQFQDLAGSLQKQRSEIHDQQSPNAPDAAPDETNQ